MALPVLKRVYEGSISKPDWPQTGSLTVKSFRISSAFGHEEVPNSSTEGSP